MAAAGAPGASSQHFDSHLESIIKLNDTVATLKAQHQEAYTLLYERFVLLETELSAAKLQIQGKTFPQDDEAVGVPWQFTEFIEKQTREIELQWAAQLSQANTDTHMSARPSCSACDT
jgi:hypothetical protein